MDIVVLSNRDALVLFRNDLAGNDVNWLQVALDTYAHPGLAPHGHGADVRILVAGQEQFYRITGGDNYLGASELVAHFGLGASAVIDEVQVMWPDGFSTVLSNVAANQRLSIAAELPFTQGTLVRGQPVALTVRGLQSGERAHFFFSSAGPGDGPCWPQFGGLCADLLSPKYIGQATADTNGVAVFNAIVPTSPGLQSLSSQVLIRRGAAGASSLKTNVITAPLLDPAA